MIVTLSQVQSAKRIPLPEGFDLAWPSDAKNKYAKSGCEAKSVILFNDNDNSMDFDNISFEKLPDTQKAALIVHETVYKFLRVTVREPDSIRVRKIVGHLFANESEAEFNKAVGEIADFYPMAVPKLSVQPNPGWEEGALVYPASYVGEPVLLNVDVKLDPSANPLCTLDNSHTGNSDWSFGPAGGLLNQGLCRGASDGSNVVLPTCLRNPVSSNLPRLLGRVRVARFVGNGSMQKRIECPVQVSISDKYGNSHSLIVQNTSSDLSWETTVLNVGWDVIVFPNRE